MDKSYQAVIKLRLVAATLGDAIRLIEARLTPKHDSAGMVVTDVQCKPSKR